MSEDEAKKLRDEYQELKKQERELDRRREDLDRDFHNLFTKMQRIEGWFSKAGMELEPDA